VARSSDGTRLWGTASNDAELDVDVYRRYADPRVNHGTNAGDVGEPSDVGGSFNGHRILPAGLRDDRLQRLRRPKAQAVMALGSARSIAWETA
jgi:hypothetical protein